MYFVVAAIIMSLTKCIFILHVEPIIFKDVELAAAGVAQENSSVSDGSTFDSDVHTSFALKALLSVEHK